MSTAGAATRRPTAESFVFGRPHLDPETGAATLPYRFTGGAAFVERFGFGPPRDPLSPERAELARRLLAYLHGAAGVSYYKALVAPALDLGATDLDVGAASFLRTLYLNGLGEFAHHNALDLAPRLNFTGARGALAPIAAVLPRRALVPVGGGKDSLVTVERLRAVGEPMALFAVNPKGPIVATIEASGLEAVTITRTLDPALFELNARGALNGHVPITAIVSLAALLAAAWHGFDRVVMSNERSADFGNFDDAGVNHQWSKSSAFEALLRAELARAVSPDLDWFSLLRPLSELAIAERFAASERYDAVFSSCNRNFHLRRPGPEGRWCRDCPKCRFVFLALAPFMAKERLTAVFGGDLLADAAQLEGFAELAGLSGHKPFECVGATGEAAAALIVLAERPEWREAPVVTALAARLASRRDELLAHFAALRAPAGPDFVPADLRGALVG